MKPSEVMWFALGTEGICKILRVIPNDVAKCVLDETRAEFEEVENTPRWRLFKKSAASIKWELAFYESLAKQGY